MYIVNMTFNLELRQNFNAYYTFRLVPLAFLAVVLANHCSVSGSRRFTVVISGFGYCVFRGTGRGPTFRISQGRMIESLNIEYQATNCILASTREQY